MERIKKYRWIVAAIVIIVAVIAIHAILNHSITLSPLPPLNIINSLVAKIPKSLIPGSDQEANNPNWKVYRDPVWNLAISYPADWNLRVERQDSSKLLISMFEKATQDVTSQRGLEILEGSMIQFSLAYSQGVLTNPEQVLQTQINIFDPRQSFLFHDPAGNLIVESYQTLQGIEGLYGSAQSSVVVREAFVFLQTVQDNTTMGVIDLIAFRPLDPEVEGKYINIFAHIINSLHLETIQ
jgi:hypothetical protein